MHGFIVVIVVVNLVVALAITPDFHDVAGWLVGTCLAISLFLRERAA